jgi:glutaredoxin
MKKAGILLGLFLCVIVLTGCNRPLIKIKGNAAELSKEEVRTKIVDFISANMVQPGTKVEVTDVAVESGLYKLNTKIAEATVLDIYATKDGKIFFPDAVNIEEIEKQIQEAKAKQMAANAGNSAQQEIPKTNKPVVDLYVMSFCPYGNKAEDTLKPVYALLKNKVTFNFHYIVNINGNTVQSLHGEKEVAQNEREACVLKNYGKDKWFEFVAYVNANCGSDGSCWEAGAQSLKIGVPGINACVASQGTNLMKADEKLAKAANASASPTMLINGVVTRAVASMLNYC